MRFAPHLSHSSEKLNWVGLESWFFLVWKVNSSFTKLIKFKDLKNQTRNNEWSIHIFRNLDHFLIFKYWAANSTIWNQWKWLLFSISLIFLKTKSHKIWLVLEDLGTLLGKITSAKYFVIPVAVALKIHNYILCFEKRSKIWFFKTFYDQKIRARV